MADRPDRRGPVLFLVLLLIVGLLVVAWGAGRESSTSAPAAPAGAAPEASVPSPSAEPPEDVVPDPPEADDAEPGGLGQHLTAPLYDGTGVYLFSGVVQQTPQ